MNIEEIYDSLGVESAEDLKYFEHFAEFMEMEEEIDYDTFSEIISEIDIRDLKEVSKSFFQDMILGIPDDNTELYASINTIRDTLTDLMIPGSSRAFAFLADELYGFRSWYVCPDIIKCTDEKTGDITSLSPCHALMLYREEKLTGRSFNYDFESGMPPAPDDYIADLVDELKEDSYRFSDSDFDDSYDSNYHDMSDGFSDDFDSREHSSYDTYDSDYYDPDYYDLPDDLPDDFDPENYDPDDFKSRPIDPYTEGFVDRYDPVIEGEDIKLDDIM